MGSRSEKQQVFSIRPESKPPKHERYQKENIVKKQGGINNCFSVNCRIRPLGKFSSSDVRHQARGEKKLECFKTSDDSSSIRDDCLSQIVESKRPGISKRHKTPFSWTAIKERSNFT